MRILTSSRWTLATLLLALSLIGDSGCLTWAAQQSDASPQTAAKKVRVVGTVKAISGNSVTLATDSGSEINLTIQSSTRLMRMEPGQTDLKNASAIQLTDIQVGDRLLAGGAASDDGKSVSASSAVLMKKTDVAEKQEHDRQEWQKNGVGGVVKSVDASTGSITLSTGTLAASTLTVRASKDTVIRRYAPDSVKFDDAKPGTLDQIKAGDQLRARGTKSEDGKELAAAEIVSGTFRNIAGLVVSTDAANNTITVTDLAAKRPVTLQVASDSQMHQLPAMVAQRIALRLKGGDVAGASSTAGASTAGASTHPQGATGSANPGGGMGQRAGASPDFQQMLNRMPAVSLSDLQKGSALMIVATEGTADSPSKVVILLSGVEPILTAASPRQATTILSPWNLSGGANAGTGEAP